MSRRGGEGKVYRRKYLNKNTATTSINPLLEPNLNQYHNPRLNGQIHGLSRQSKESVAVPDVPDLTMSPTLKSMSFNETKKSSSHGGHVTFNLATYSRRGLLELKKRLISELRQVRSLITRIESGDFGFGPGFPSTQPSLTHRPPPLQVNCEVDLPKPKEKCTPNVNHRHQSSELLTGKNKRPGARISGTKRSRPFGLGKDAKRSALEHPVTEKLTNSMMKRCGHILRKLMKHKFGWVFNVPVDVAKLGLHDYNRIVKTPMDLGTVKSHLQKNLYISPLHFAADVRLTFNNALLYNPKGTDVNFMAEQLLSMFDAMFNPAYNKFEAEQHRVSKTIKESRPMVLTQKTQRAISGPMPGAVAKKLDSAMERSRPTFSNPSQLPAPMRSMPIPMLAPVPVAKPVVAQRPLKLPKPKAKDPNKREMSYEERAKLGQSLQNLPPEKMEQFVQILKKRNEQLVQHGDEIELDIEAIDTETLWELDRFVTYHKKMVSKMKRQGLLIQSNSQRSNEIQISNKSPLSEMVAEAGLVQKSKKGEFGEEDVDIGEEIPLENFPPVVIDKDATACAGSGSSGSSCSTSSSDSSSSSDSDSESSSASGSDAESVQSPFVELKEAQRA
ncbi:hypothetical protein I3843_07G041500 [Carya illinoinensis]|nr:hypothetical protein I3843_07G041500 [Carya illinoinensis]